MTHQYQTNIDAQVSAARKARAMARKFDAMGKAHIANQIRLLSFESMQYARRIKSGLIGIDVLKPKA